MRFLKFFTSFVFAALLAACGGGGETSPDTSTSYDKVVVSWGGGQIALIEQSSYNSAVAMKFARNESKFSDLRICQKQDAVAEDGSIPFMCASGGLWVWVQLDPVQGVLQDFSGTPPTVSGVLVDFEVAATEEGVYSIIPDALTLEFTPNGGSTRTVATSTLEGGTFNWIQRYRYSKP